MRAGGRTGLVRDDNVLPVVLANDLCERLGLASDDLLGLVALTLLERLANAEDDLDVGLEGGGGLRIGAGRGGAGRGQRAACREGIGGRAREAGTNLLGDELVRLVEDGAALRVAEDDPVEANVLELLEPVMGHSRQVRKRSSLHRVSEGERTDEISPV